ncbi:hypothetical protein COC46_18455, partial [Bacillus sp. AFS041924]
NTIYKHVIVEDQELLIAAFFIKVKHALVEQHDRLYSRFFSEWQYSLTREMTLLLTFSLYNRSFISSIYLNRSECK